MFLAPCTLPIVPGYVAFIAGSRKLVLRNAVAFVLGFTVVFVLLGASAGLFGILIGPWRYEVARLGGVVIIIFGLTMLGLLRLPGLSGEHRLSLPRFLSIGNPISSAFIGALFALGWSPCIGPILGTILFIASASATAGQGALLLLVFSLGLGLPFILTALMLERIGGTFGALSRATQTLSTIGGAFLLFLGILMVFDQTAVLVSMGYGLLNFIGYDRLLNYL